MVEDHLPENISGKIKFFKGTEPGVRENYLDQVNKGLADKKGVGFFEAVEGKAEHQLTDEETELLQTMLTNAQDKLHDLNCDSLIAYLPTIDQIIIRDVPAGYMPKQPEEKQVGGRVEVFGELLKIFLPRGMDLSHIQAKAVFYHELSHYISQIIVKDYHEHACKTAYGFNRPDGRFGDVRGLYEESLAVIFALFCSDTDKTIVTSYRLQVPFMISLLTRIAQLKNIKALEAFQQMFKAEKTRDFSYQADLVKLFDDDSYSRTGEYRGKTIMRSLNSILSKNISGDGVSKKENLRDMARMAGFLESYDQLQKEIDSGVAISFPGIKGGIKKNSGVVE